MTEQLFNLTVPSGKTYRVRPLPKHMILFFAALPFDQMQNISDSSGTAGLQQIENDLQESLTPAQITKTLIFIREAVTHCCISPRITLTPQNEDEISPFEISEEDFFFIGRWALKGAMSGNTADEKTADEQAADEKNTDEKTAQN